MSDDLSGEGVGGEDEARIWPSAFDAETLARAIRDLRSIPDDQFYMSSSRLTDDDVFQGDVVEFRCEVPVIDEAGEPATLDYVDYWLVLANTCDLARTREESDDFDFAPVVPIIRIPTDPDDDAPTTATYLDGIRKYFPNKMFYLPPWGAGIGDDMIADFTRIVSMHREAFDKIKVVARLRLKSWTLMNACLTRHLCREDGRYDDE